MQQPNEEEPIPLLPRSQAGPSRSIQGSPRPTNDIDGDAAARKEDLAIKAARARALFSGRRSRRLPLDGTEQKEARRSKDSLRHALYLLLERPTSSNSAFTLHLVTNTIIVLSAILTILETLPLFHAVDSSLWFGLETMVVVLFSVEYIARSIAWGFGEPGEWKKWWNWATSFFALIDLFAILPYYIELAVKADTTAFFRFSILRTFRLLRVFRPFRYSSTILLTIEVMILSTRRSKHALLALSFFVTMAVIVFSTLLYFAERGTWDETLETFVDSEGVKTQFESIPAAAWFVLVTITTVGYGEIIPRTFLGRLITVPLLLFGLLLVALPSFVLGREFAVVWEEMSAGVLDGLSLNTRALDSPMTPYTGRSAAVYDLIPEPEQAHNDDEEEEEVDDTATLVSQKKGKGKARRVLFDSEDRTGDADDENVRKKELDEETGLGGGPTGLGGASNTTATATATAAVPPATSLPNLLSKKEARRKRVDSNAEAHTSAFMGLGGAHRRNVSKVDLLGMGGTSVSVGPGSAHTGGSGEAQLASLIKELKMERDALRVEREAIKAERAALSVERVELGKERDKLRGRG